MKRTAATEIRAPDRFPRTAPQTLPPSSRNKGSMLSALAISPEYPASTRQCIGIGCAVGIMSTFGANRANSPPTTELDCSKVLGTIGRDTKRAWLHVVENLIPKTSMPMDTDIAARGPAIARSNKSRRLGGKLSSLVIHPSVPR